MKCSICLNLIGRRTKFKTKCNHTFHSRCLLKWVLIKSSCPICRALIREEEEEEEEEIFIDGLDLELELSDQQFILDSLNFFLIPHQSIKLKID